MEAQDRTPARPRRARLAPLAGLAALLALLALLAAGCGEGGSDSGQPELGFLTATTDLDVFKEMNYGAVAAGEKYGADVKLAAPNGINGAEEVKLFEDMTHTAGDGIGVETTTPELFGRPMSDAVGEGIPIVSVDSAPPEHSEVNTFIGNSNREIGEKLAQQVLTQVPAGAGGEVVIGDDVPGTPLMDQRAEAMVAVVEAERPDLTVVGPFDSKAEPTENYNAWKTAVNAHPDAVAYLGPGEQDGVSLAKIAQTNGEHYLVGACDLNPVSLKAVQDGYIYALVDPQHWLKGYLTIALLAKQAKDGQPLPEGWLNTGTKVITKANVEKIIERQQSTASRAAYFAPIGQQLLSHLDTEVEPIAKAD